MQELNLATKEKQDEILAKPTGIAWGKYSTRKSGQVNESVLTNVNTFYPVIHVEGSGTLNAFVLKALAGTGYNLTKIRISVDGVVTFQTSVGKGNFIGLLPPVWDIQKDNIYNTFSVDLEYPYVKPDITSQGFLNLYTPIFFNSELKIELQRDAKLSNNNNLFKYDYSIG